ncbi:MAG: purine-nucleoside phosphorylase [Spirochaetaceae bacterium]|jgi:purine-nucleoside phosphorylase|nr:purine-nucleoside phosphorylase [Spirochaetaceae bacterium]
MSVHIDAKAEDVAELVLLTGDPLRAQFIAENFLSDALRYNSVRNMYGYTGLYKGRRVSVQGTGMGTPSISIYANELFRDFGVKRAIRTGTAGSIQPNICVRDLVFAMTASSDSGTNGMRFGGRHYAPAASFRLLDTAYRIACSLGLSPFVGPVVTTDRFYRDDPDEWKLWAKYGCLAIEMECAELYTLAAKYGREALTILTISDSLVSHEETNAYERQVSFTHMMEVALETVISE